MAVAEDGGGGVEEGGAVGGSGEVAGVISEGVGELGVHGEEAEVDEGDGR